LPALRLQLCDLCRPDESMHAWLKSMSQARIFGINILIVSRIHYRRQTLSVTGDCCSPGQLLGVVPVCGTSAEYEI